MTLVEEKTLVTESVRLHRDAVEVAYEVGEYLRGVFRKPFEVEEKVDHTDLVTEHDRASERMIVAALRERDPSYGFLGEEFGAQPGEGPVTWHLDPIDGTSNFVQGHAFFCVSIAAEVEGRVVAGAVYDPMADNMFSADLERAYLNSEVLVTPQAKQPPQATIILSYPGARDLRMEAPSRWGTSKRRWKRSHRCCAPARVRSACVAWRPAGPIVRSARTRTRGTSRRPC